MNNVSNPNDFKVVVFKNSTDFDFTTEMGCMYDGRPIFGISGVAGVKAGESITLPYHVGHQLAVNLAKAGLTRSAPSVDQAGVPTGVPLWDISRLENMKNSYLTEMYTEEKPTAMSETDRLMAKVEELNKFVRENVKATAANTISTVVEPSDAATLDASATPTTYQDKAEVIAELTKRGIKFDARKGKSDLEKLLA